MLPATWIRTLVPNQQSGEISLQTGVTNHAATPVSGILRGVIMPGNVRFSQPIELDAGQTQNLELSKAQFAQLAIANPKLWWPNGYGAPNLYNCQLAFITEAGRAALKIGGENVMTIHCRQTQGGQYVDVGLSPKTVPKAMK